MYEEYNMAVAPHVMFDGGWRNRYLSVGSYWSYHTYLEECCQRAVIPLDLEVAISWPMADQIQVDITAGLAGGTLNRGDLDHSGGVPNIVDLVILVGYMFQGEEAPACMVEADIDGDGQAVPQITDLVHLVAFMFQQGDAPVPCP